MDSRLKVSRGGAILRSAPYVFVLFRKHRGELCDECFKRCPLSRCSSCKTDYYCSVDCQRAAWKALHKYECKLLKTSRLPAVTDNVRLLAKVIMRHRQCHQEKEDERVHDGYGRSFTSLMSHKEAYLSGDGFEELTCMRDQLRAYLPEEMIPASNDELASMYGKMTINGFTVTLDDQTAVGVAVYRAASVFDHSCRPNAAPTFDGPNVIVRATEAMDTTWGQVRINYCELLWSRGRRRAFLFKHYKFWCNCSRCGDETCEETLLCESCDNEVRLPAAAVKSSDQSVRNGKEAIPSGDKAIPSDDEAILSVDKAIPSVDKAIPSDDEAIPSDDEAIPSDDEAIPSGDKAIPSYDDTVLSDNVAVYSDNVAVTSDNVAGSRGGIKCQSCGYDSFHPATRSAYNAMAEECGGLSNANDVSLAQCEKLLDMQRLERKFEPAKTQKHLTYPGTAGVIEVVSALHPTDIWRVTVLDAAMEAAIREAKFDVALRYGLSNVVGMSHYHGLVHPTTAYFLTKLGKLALHEDQLGIAGSILATAREQLSLCYGANHRLVETVDEMMRETSRW